MSKYLEPSVDADAEDNERVYVLTGVLMHVGAEANHGHYIAHIQEFGSGKWFKFSDAYVEALDPRSNKSRLGAEPDTILDCENDLTKNEVGSRAKKGVGSKNPKVPKGFQVNYQNSDRVEIREKASRVVTFKKFLFRARTTPTCSSTLS